MKAKTDLQTGNPRNARQKKIDRVKEYVKKAVGFLAERLDDEERVRILLMVKLSDLLSWKWEQTPSLAKSWPYRIRAYLAFGPAR